MGESDAELFGPASGRSLSRPAIALDDLVDVVMELGPSLAEVIKNYRRSTM
jgi:hypothetical protein